MHRDVRRVTADRNDGRKTTDITISICRASFHFKFQRRNDLVKQSKDRQYSAEQRPIKQPVLPIRISETPVVSAVSNAASSREIRSARALRSLLALASGKELEKVGVRNRPWSS